MQTRVLMPSMGASMEVGTVIAWQVDEGQQVAVGTVLCELETDKTTVEFESPVAGTVLELVAPVGQATAVGELIVIIGDPSDGPVEPAPSTETSPVE